MIEILIAGDLCTDGRIEEKILSNPNWNCFQNISDVLSSKDLSIVNLECPLTTSIKKIIKSGPSIKADPKTISILTSGYFDVVTLANNHILDFGKNGLEETINICTQNSIKHVGVGKDLKEASKPLFIKIKNKKIGIVNIAENEFSVATVNSSGVNPLNPIQNFYQIQAAKNNADIVLVIVHGGNEYYELPSPRFKETLRFFADAGATAVIAHHTHISSGYETYNNVPIFYGLGNFLFDKINKSDAWHEGYIVKLKFDDILHLAYEIIPYTQCLNSLSLEMMEKKEKRNFLQHLNKLSGIIKNDDELMKKWDKFLLNSQGYYLSILFSLNRLQRRLLKWGTYKNWILWKKNIPPILNYFTCEAHRDVMAGILKKEINKEIM
jgi:hypothetical protein